jgi:prolipoprotein diacylglyceryl transferase
VIGAHLLLTIPAPAIRQFDIGPLSIRIYALCLLTGVVVAAIIATRRWTAMGGHPDLVLEVTLWSVLGGLVGGRAYHDVTSWNEVGHEWYGFAAIWEGGLGIWGGVLVGVLVGAYVTRRRGQSVMAMMDAAAPGILVAQAIGRLGNYFNQELYGGPTTLPWGLHVDSGFRPDGKELIATYQPTFLYELLWNLAGAALIIWIGKRFRIRPPGVFCLYVSVYCAGRIWWEELRIDPSKMYLGHRLNFYVAIAGLVLGLIAFVWTQRRAGPDPVVTRGDEDVPAGGVPARAGGSRAKPARR